MANDRISSYIDVSAIKAETETLLAEIKRVRASIENVNSAKVQLKQANSGKEVQEGIKAASAASQGFEREVKKANISLNEQAQRIRDLREENLRLGNERKRQAIENEQRIANEKAKLLELAAIEKQRKLDAKNAPVENVPANTTEKREELKVEEEILDVNEEQLKTEQEIRETRKKAILDRIEEARKNSKNGTETPKKSSDGISFVPINDLEQQVSILNKSKDALAKNIQEEKLLKELLSEGKITRKQYTEQLKANTIAQLENRQSIKSANDSIKILQKNDQVVKGSLDQRRLALIRLNKEYDNLGPQERASAAGVRLQRIIAGLTTQVKNLEAATGRAQRNVGNYPEAAAGGFDKLGAAAGKAFGVLRNIAYIVPGLGIAGLLGILIDPIVAYVGKLFEVNNAITKTAEVIGETKGEFSKAAESVNELRINIELAKQGFIDKDKVVDQYNETIGKTTGRVTSLDQAEKELAKNADAYIKFTLLKAAATAAMGKAAGLALDAQVEIRKDAKKEATFFDNISSLFGQDFDSPEARAEYQRKLEVAGQKNKVATVNQLNKNRKQFEQIAADFQKQAAELAAKFKFNFFQDTEAPEDAKVPTKLLAIKKEFDADVLQSEADVLKQLSKNDDLYIFNRIKNRNKAFDLEEEIRRKTLQAAVSNAEAELKASLDAENAKGKGADKNAIINARNKFNADVAKAQKEYDKKEVEQEAQLATDLLEIRNKVNQKELQDARVTREELTKLTEARKKDQLAAITNRVNRETNSLERDKDNRLAIIEEEKAALLSVARTSEQRQKIESAASRKSLDVEIQISKLKIALKIKEQEDLLAIVGKDDENEKERLKSQIAQLKKQLAALKGDQAKNDADGRDADAAKAIEVLDKINDYYGQISNTISSALNARATAEKNALQDQIDMIEKKRQIDLDAIAASTAAEQDKAAAIIRINAVADAKKQQLELRQRQVDQRKAEFDKAAGIGQIIINTAIAVSKLLATPPLAVAAGVLGAAQLAIAVATPVPRYKDGTMNHPGGKFVAGDGGKRELIVGPDGKMRISDNKPTLYEGAPGTMVFPDVEKLNAKAFAMSFNLPAMAQPKKEDTKSYDMLNKGLGRIERAIKSQPGVTVSTTWNGAQVGYKSQQKYWEWVNRMK